MLADTTFSAQALTAVQPPATVRCDLEGTGEAFVPEVFAHNLQTLVAALDWARVFIAQERPSSWVAAELLAGAEAAELLASACRSMSERALAS
jgi:hypothetical protein